MAKTLGEINEAILTQRIHALLTRPKTQELIQRYFNPMGEEPFAGDLFDTLGENLPKTFGRDDLLSLNLLDEPVNAHQVKRVTSGEFDALLAEVCPTAHITNLSGATFGKATALWEALSDVKGFGPTRISKLLARKRPNLLPIRDSVVNRVLEIEGYSWWKALSQTMTEAEIVSLLTGLRPTANKQGPSLLRVLDVAIWMHGSNSRAARKVRREFGLTS